MNLSVKRGLSTALMALLGTALLTACTSVSLQQAPVVDRSVRGSGAATTGTAAPRPTAGVDAARPGFYTVQPGDTFMKISRERGIGFRDLLSWNNLQDPNQLAVGQVIRIAPPSQTGGGEAGSGVVVTGVPSSTITTAPLTPSAPAAPSTPPSADEPAWIWPNYGQVIGTFDAEKNKGIDIAGKAGDPIVAVADGRVIVADDTLRGYGKLVILKHNDTFLTAYAHNQTLFVKEDELVRKGQKIAEMGSTEADRVKLHFEIRKQGKPVDPLLHLPRR